MEPNQKERVRAALAEMDDRQRKIVGGVLAVMFASRERVREREWMVEQFTEVTLLACDFEDVPSVQDGMQQVQDYVRANIDTVLNACFMLFTQVAVDLQSEDVTSFSQQEAMERALNYF